MKDDRTKPRSGRPIVVMFSVPPPTVVANPYTTMLFEAVANPGLTVLSFSWKSALTRHIDILHVHWPENLVRNPNGLKRTVRSLAGFLFLVKKRLTGITIVWTVHNLAPHESGGVLEKAFLRWFYANVDHRIYINESVENTVGPSTTILHGTYEPWYPRENTSHAPKTGLLLFGIVRPYKGIEALLTAYEQTADPAIPLTIAGRPSSAEYSAQVQERAKTSPGVHLHLRHVSDGELTELVSAAAVVVLPYTQMYNSGALLMALSLGTHVLAPVTPSNIALREEFGPEWISLFDQPLQARHLTDALTAASALPTGAMPDMSRRTWNDLGDQHVALYQRLVVTRP